MSDEGNITAKLRLRLVIALPALVSLFMVTTGLLLYYSFQNIFPRNSFPAAGLERAVPLWIAVMTLLAYIGNLMAAYTISRYLRDSITRMRKLLSQDPGQSTEIVAGNEMAALGIILDEVSVSLSKFIHDSHIVENLPEALITVTRAGEIRGLNRNAAGLLGADPSEIKGKALKDFFPDHDDNASFFHLVDEGFRGKNIALRQVEAALCHRGCQPYWVGITPLGDNGETPEAIFIHFKNQESIVAIRTQIQKLERLAALGLIASNMAHEVRNPLGAMKTFTELIQEDLAPDDPKRGYTEEIINQANRLNHLMQEILSFSRDSIVIEEEVDVRHLLAQSVSLARHSFPDKIVAIHEDYQAGLPPIKGDPDKLSQAFLNIIKNAFESLQEKGRIDVSARGGPDEAMGNGHVHIHIADSGIHIPADNLHKIFEPFYTTKKGNGTGLGLSITQHIITAHGGQIEVHSRPEQGTTFHIVLPGKNHVERCHKEEGWNHD